MARRKSPGSVYQRADGKWVAQLYGDDGRKIRKYATTQDAAKKLLTELRRAPVKRAPRAGTVIDQVRLWSEETLPRTGAAPSTVATYCRIVENPLAPTLGDVRLSAFTPTAAEAWLGRLSEFKTRRGTTISRNTQRLTYAVLRRALDTAVRDGLINANPLASVQRPSPGRPSVPMSMDVDALLATIPEEENIRPLVVFVAWTGCRLGEALALRWEDVDLARGTAVIRRSSTDRDVTKGGGIRAVPLIPEVVAALAPREHPTGLVFTTTLGTPLYASSARRTLRGYLRAADMPAERPFHTMRHNCASRLLNRGVPMPVVSKILGHASITTTVDIYGHLDPAMAAEQMAQALSKDTTRLRVVS